MALLKSMNSGVSGLNAFQKKMDVIGNNIANVETIGFSKFSKFSNYWIYHKLLQIEIPQ